MEFKVGDKAVVPNLGVGVCTRLTTFEDDGETIQIYVFEIMQTKSNQPTTYSVNKDFIAAEGVRELIPLPAIERVYDILRDKETPADKQTWNRRYREYLQKINSGDPFEVASVLRDLARLKTEKTLSFGERKMFDQAHSLIVQEIAVARDVTEQVVADELEAIFNS
jgi:CarD family transcriptional regulator